MKITITKVLKNEVTVGLAPIKPDTNSPLN